MHQDGNNSIFKVFPVEKMITLPNINATALVLLGGCPDTYMTTLVIFYIHNIMTEDTKLFTTGSDLFFSEMCPRVHLNAI